MCRTCRVVDSTLSSEPTPADHAESVEGLATLQYNIKVQRGHRTLQRLKLDDSAARTAHVQHAEHITVPAERCCHLWFRLKSPPLCMERASARETCINISREQDPPYLTVRESPQEPTDVRSKTTRQLYHGHFCSQHGPIENPARSAMSLPK